MCAAGEHRHSPRERSDNKIMNEFMITEQNSEPGSGKRLASSFQALILIFSGLGIESRLPDIVEGRTP